MGTTLRSVLLPLTLAMAACAVNPATGAREFSLIGTEREIAMGREADGDISASMGLVDDAELQAYVSEIGTRMAAVSERPDLPWSFKVVDDPIVNAFALPGGFIYVTRGILAHFDSEAELAGVLGHEIGHVTARHSVSQMSRQQLQMIGLGVGMVFSETVREYGSLAAATLGLLNLRYSRGDESESDELGHRYMTRVGYDPEALVGVFQMLASVSGGGEGRIPEWQLTHPYPENREARIREIIAEAGTAGGTVERERYLDRIDGMVYGPNPREGFFEGSAFYHPDLAFEMRFPEGWQGVNQRQAVLAVSPAEDALVGLSIAPDETDPERALRAFLSQQGITGGAVRTSEDYGIQLARARFSATTEDGELRGEVAYLLHGGAVFRLIGYAPSGRWSTYEAVVAATLGSFAPLRDASRLSVQPRTLEIVTTGSAMSVEQFLERHPSTVPTEEVLRLNRLEAGARIPAGTRLKRVVGGPA